MKTGHLKTEIEKLEISDENKNKIFELIDREMKVNVPELVEKFLRWELPKSVCSDQCVAVRDYKFPRSGTNLLDINEAKQMIEYLLSDFLR